MMSSEIIRMKLKLKEIHWLPIYLSGKTSLLPVEQLGDPFVLLIQGDHLAGQAIERPHVLAFVNQPSLRPWRWLWFGWGRH